MPALVDAMPEVPPYDTDLIATHTTAASTSVAHWVALHHGIPVERCHLIRRGLNDNYDLRARGGARYVVRVYSIRPRGGFNIDFEAALLEHLHDRGAGVAPLVKCHNGQTHAVLRFPEGTRALTLFQYVDGAVPDTLEEFELTGCTLAHIHAAARDYAGPPSRYILDGHHLVGRTLQYLEAYPDLDPAVLDAYRALAGRLLEELTALEPGLSRVVCHGDTHGFNNHIHTGPDGSKAAAFFDFDDAGPGFLAYDLSVLPWSYMVRKTIREPDDTLRERWTHYLRGYRCAGGEISEDDIKALPMFVQLRHLWNMGEAVGRLHHWGTSMAPADWLKKQIDGFEAWKGLDLTA
ncbi:phosphotransferase enzyme family protein [Acidovorax sp.]|jgi:Ser/Thr protein kinase RdoA (MazF antagonist)|uniref:phosphotransferase enzyme family protein n=1 Tax=Acidovorax sp. TaxID=1872122 RepID=UPI00391F1957